MLNGRQQVREGSCILQQTPAVLCQSPSTPVLTSYRRPCLRASCQAAQAKLVERNMTRCISACRGGVFTLWNKGPPKALWQQRRQLSPTIKGANQAHWYKQGVSEGSGNGEWKGGKTCTSISLWLHTVNAPLPPAEVIWQWLMLCSSWCFMLTTLTGPAINQQERKSTRTMEGTYYFYILTLFLTPAVILTQVSTSSNICTVSYLSLQNGLAVSVNETSFTILYTFCIFYNLMSFREWEWGASRQQSFSLSCFQIYPDVPNLHVPPRDSLSHSELWAAEMEAPPMWTHAYCKGWGNPPLATRLSACFTRWSWCVSVTIMMIQRDHHKQ